MAVITRPFGLTHLKSGLISGGNSLLNGLLYADAAPTAAVRSATSTAGIVVNGDQLDLRTITLSGSAAYTCVIGLGLYKLLGLTTAYSNVAGNCFSIGMKIVLGTGYQNASKVVGITASAVSSTLAPVSLITTADLTTTGNYFEFVFTYASSTTTTVDIYRDGDLLRTVTVSATIANLVNAGSITTGDNGSASALYPASYTTAAGTTLWSFMDIYAASGLSSGADRLGPITVKALPVISDNAPPWVVSDGTSIENVLNLTENHATDTSPYITSDASNTPLTVRVDTSSLLSTSRILGMSTVFSASRPAGAAAALIPSIAKNGTTVTGASVSSSTPAGTASQIDALFPVAAALPDGSAFTKANIAATDLTLTPA